MPPFYCQGLLQKTATPPGPVPAASCYPRRHGTEGVKPTVIAGLYPKRLQFTTLFYRRRRVPQRAGARYPCTFILSSEQPTCTRRYG